MPQFEGSEEHKENLDKIRHNVIVRYLHEKIVVDLFMRCIEKAEHGTNNDFKNLFIENCGFLQEVEFDLGSVHIKSELKIKAREMVEIEIESSLS